MWLFPVGFFLTSLLPGWPTHTAQYTLLWVLIVAVCLWIAGGPRRKGSATWSQTVFWANLVPFLIWIAIIAAVVGITYAAGAV